jgi:hypothetical protein
MRGMGWFLKSKSDSEIRVVQDSICKEQDTLNSLCDHHERVRKEFLDLDLVDGDLILAIEKFNEDFDRYLSNKSKSRKAIVKLNSMLRLAQDLSEVSLTIVETAIEFFSQFQDCSESVRFLLASDDTEKWKEFKILLNVTLSKFKGFKEIPRLSCLLAAETLSMIGVDSLFNPRELNRFASSKEFLANCIQILLSIIQNIVN